MMRWIIGSSLRLRLLVLVVAAGVMAFGVVRLRDAPVDVLPEFTPPYVEIQTEALGLSANEVEQLITVPLEADLLNGVAGVDTIRSESVPGLSSIVMVFRPGTDIYKGRALVQERLTQAHALPNVSKPPLMLQPKSSSSRVLMIGLSDGAKKLTPIEQGILARWTIRPRLLGVPGRRERRDLGSARAAAAGAGGPAAPAREARHARPGHRDDGQRPARLAADVPRGVDPGHGRLHRDAQPAPAGPPRVRPAVDAGGARERPARGLAAGNLSLGDVATITEDHQPLIGDAVVAGGDGLMLVVEKLPGANTLAVTRARRGGARRAAARAWPG